MPTITKPTTKNTLIAAIKQRCRVYTDHMVQIGRSEHGGIIWGPEETRFELPYTVCGDYCGSAVEESNRQYFQENYSVVETDSFGYGAQNAYIRGTQFKRMNVGTLQLLLDDLERLERYPLLDEDGHSQVEMEWSNETWENCYRADVIRDLEKHFGDDFDIERTRLDRLVWRAMEMANVYWENEQGNSMYLDTDKLLPHLILLIQSGETG